MPEIRELSEGETALAAEALLLLRPRWRTTAQLVVFIDTELRPAGYRLVGAFEPSSESALSVLGFREVSSTAWGRFIYVDDVSTLEQARGQGLADGLLQWLVAEARRRGRSEIHLDSGVGSDRAAAHRLYLRNHYRISAHHFSFGVEGRPAHGADGQAIRSSSTGSMVLPGPVG